MEEEVNFHFTNEELVDESSHVDECAVLEEIKEEVAYSDFDSDLQPHKIDKEDVTEEELQLTEEELFAKKKKKITDIIWYVIFAVVLVVTIACCCSVLLFDSYVVDGSSMENTVYTGDKVTVCVWDKPKVGDVIVLKDKSDSKLLIKRYIAKGPARVKIDVNGNVYVNSLDTDNAEDFVMLDEPYVSLENKVADSSRFVDGLRYEDSGTGYRVEKGKIFYLGDNRRVSSDSRMVGAVDEKDIIGKVSEYFLKRKNTKFYYILTKNPFKREN